MELLDLLGDAICHRDPRRTAEGAWICLRCTALYGAGMVGVGWAGAFRKLALWGQLAVAGLLLAPVFLDGWFVPWGSPLDQPWLRISTGALAGLGSGLFMGARAAAVVRWPAWLEPLRRGAPVGLTAAAVAGVALQLATGNTCVLDAVTVLGLVLLCLAGTGWVWATLAWLVARRRAVLHDSFQRAGLAVMAALVPVELVVVSVIPDRWKPGMAWAEAILRALGLGALALALLPAVPARAHLPHDVVAEVAIGGSGDEAHIVAQYLYPARRLFVISEDGGRTWAFRADADSGEVLQQLLLAGDVLFAVEDDTQTALRSDDGGFSWDRTGELPSNDRFDCLAAPPDFDEDEILYAGTSGALYSSPNLGETWIEIVPEFWKIGPEYLIAGPGPAWERHLYGYRDHDLFRSMDGGATFQRIIELDTVELTALALTPLYPLGRVVLGTDEAEILVSSDAGQSWSTSALDVVPDEPIHDAHVVADIQVLSEDRVLVITQGNGVFCTDDAGGDGFTLCGEGIPEGTPQYSFEWGYFRRLAASPDDPETVALAAWQGLYLSHDGGERWHEACFLRPPYTRGLAFSPSYPDDPRVYVASYGGGLYASPDGGESWAVQADAQEFLHLEGLTLAPSFPGDGRMFLVASRRLLRSADGGAHWQRAELDGVAALHQVELSPWFADDGVAYALGTTADEGQWVLDRSDDGGESWSLAWIGDDVDWHPQITDLVMSPSFDGTGPLYGIQQNPAAVVVSTDGGSTWMVDTAPAEGVAALWAFPGAAADELVLATETGRVLRREPSGGWTDLAYTGGPPLRGHALGGDAIAASLDPVGLSLSRDRGANWEVLDAPFGSPVLAVAAPPDPDDPTLVASTHYGAFFRCDEGDDWHLLDRLMRLEDDACDLRYAGGGWARAEGTGSGDGATRSSTAGDTATVGFDGAGVRWRAARGPDRGSATVAVDGVEVATVDLSAGDAGSPEVVFEQTLEAHGWHELTIAVVGDGIVEIDAVDVIRHAVDNGPGEHYEIAAWCRELGGDEPPPPGDDDDGCCASSCDHDRSPASAAAALFLLGTLLLLRRR